MTTRQTHPVKVVATVNHVVYLVISQLAYFGCTTLQDHGVEGVALNGETTSYLQEISHGWLGNPNIS
jgi:hypothetical protein